MDIYFLNIIVIFDLTVKVFRSFRDYNESSFQSAIECMIPSKFFRSEIRLIAEEIPKPKKYNYRFVDIFMCDGYDILIIELKLFNLVSLFCGEYDIWNKNPLYETFTELNSKLKQESNEETLDQNYIFWCKTEQKPKSVKVVKCINDGFVQLNTYINIMKKGGILDERIIRYDAKSHVWRFL